LERSCNRPCRYNPILKQPFMTKNRCLFTVFKWLKKDDFISCPFADSLFYLQKFCIILHILFVGDLMNRIKIGCVILAAGQSTRFGENKLLAKLDGIPLSQRIMQTVSSCSFYRTVIVTQYPSIEQFALPYHFSVVFNTHPDWGISESIRLGTDLLQDCDGILYCTADQPMLSQKSIQIIMNTFIGNPRSIVCAAVDGSSRNPCLFPAACFSQLLSLQGDKGGRSLLKYHSWIPVDIPYIETVDCDTPDALQKLQERRS